MKTITGKVEFSVEGGKLYANWPKENKEPVLFSTVIHWDLGELITAELLNQPLVWGELKKCTNGPFNVHYAFLRWYSSLDKLKMSTMCEYILQFTLTKGLRTCFDFLSEKLADEPEMTHLKFFGSIQAVGAIFIQSGTTEQVHFCDLLFTTNAESLQIFKCWLKYPGIWDGKFMCADAGITLDGIDSRDICNLMVKWFDLLDKGHIRRFCAYAGDYGFQEEFKPVARLLSEMEDASADDELFEDDPAVEDDPVTSDGPIAEDDTAVGDEPVTKDDAVVGDETVAEDTAVEDEPITEGDTAVGDEPVTDDPVVGDEPVTDDTAVGDEPITEDERTSDKSVPKSFNSINPDYFDIRDTYTTYTEVTRGKFVKRIRNNGYTVEEEIWSLIRKEGKRDRVLIEKNFYNTKGDQGELLKTVQISRLFKKETEDSEIDPLFSS